MADKFSDYYYLPVKVTATVDGTEVPVTEFSVNYDVNSIPEAEITIAVGRRMDGKNFGKTSAGQGVLTTLAPFTPVEVSMQIDATPEGRAAPVGKTPGVPLGKPFKVFDGFLSSPGQVKSSPGATAGLQFTAFGLPGALAGSTSFITGLTVADPQHGSESITAKLGVGPGAPTVHDAILKRLGGSMLADVYSGVIKPIFEEIVSTTDIWSNAAGADSSDNSFASVALSRIESGREASAAPPMDLTIYLVDDLKDMFTKAVSRYLVDTVFQSWASTRAKGFGSDLWDILMKMAGDLLFSFVPAIDFDTVVPITYGLNAEPWATISPSEYWGMAMGKGVNEKMYAYTTTVGLLSQNLFHVSPWQAGTVKIASWGAATVDPEELPGVQQLTGKPRGKTELIQAPPWLIIAGPPPKDSIQPGGAVPDGLNPDGNEGPAVDPASAYSLHFSEGMGNAVAASKLYDLIFAHRRMAIQGRLRVDIAPGSLIRVETVGERFSGVKDTYYGHVLRTRLVVSSGGANGQPVAYTDFVLSHIRSEKEQNSKTLTTSVHPLYQKAWRGSALTTEL